MRTGEKTAPPAYRTPAEGNMSPHLLSRAQTLCCVLLRCNHNSCAHSVSNMPLRVSSGTSAQVKYLNGSMRIGAAISTVRACSEVNAIGSSPCRRNAASVSQALYSPYEVLPKAPDTETWEVTTEILLYMHSA